MTLPPAISVGGTHGPFPPGCFVGHDAIEWRQRQVRFTQEEAGDAGRALVERGLIPPVLDEHDLDDANDFHRSYADETSAQQPGPDALRTPSRNQPEVSE